jgi:HTH-type transcriptional regulator/antitoxin HipB
MKIRTVNELGVTIRRARKQRGWTQDDLAVRAGISRRTLVALEGGNPRGEIGIVVRVVAALDRELTITERSSGGGDDLLGHVHGAGE